MNLVRKMRKSLRRGWMNYALRGVGANDNYKRLDLAYRIGDPWNMESDLERFRLNVRTESFRRICRGFSQFWRSDVVRVTRRSTCGASYRKCMGLM